MFPGSGMEGGVSYAHTEDVLSGEYASRTGISTGTGVEGLSTPDSQRVVESSTTYNSAKRGAVNAYSFEDQLSNPPPLLSFKDICQEGDLDLNLNDALQSLNSFREFYLSLSSV